MEPLLTNNLMNTDLKQLTVFNNPRENEFLADLDDRAKLCRELYAKSDGDLSKYVSDLVVSDENVYLEKVAKRASIPEVLENALCLDLQILQNIADFKCSKIEGMPCYTTSNVDLKKAFREVVDNIFTRGYGKWSNSTMFEFDENLCDIALVKHPDKTTFADLFDYERERRIVVNNTLSFLDGKPAQNILLTGDAGTGKSSTVKATVNEYASRGLRIIEVKKSQVKFIPEVIAQIEDNPLRFIIFIDDISFSTDDDAFGELKALLEGSLCAQSENVLIYATSNRRHIVKEKWSDREGDEIHVNDSIQEMVSLSERFGLHVTFSRPQKKLYLDIVHKLLEKQNAKNLPDDVDILAERFATRHGGRSGRCAKQFVETLLAG